MTTTKKNIVEELQKAEANAGQLFEEINRRALILPGKTEMVLNQEIYHLAFELFNVQKYWHKRIVRAGSNTLYPYRDNPPNRLIEEDDILFLDFGPVFEDFEADYGRTYVLGTDPQKIKLGKDVETAWHEGFEFYQCHKNLLTAADFFFYTQELATKYGWQYGGPHCGHLIGKFPHEKIQGDQVINYLHPDNNRKMNEPDIHNNPRHWIFEIHFIDQDKSIGGFFEQLLYDPKE